MISTLNITGMVHSTTSVTAPSKAPATQAVTAAAAAVAAAAAAVAVGVVTTALTTVSITGGFLANVTPPNTVAKYRVGVTYQIICCLPETLALTIRKP